MIIHTNSILRRAMPMRLATRNLRTHPISPNNASSTRNIEQPYMHYIPHLQPPGLLALGANQPAAHRDGEDLAALVRVPERPRAAREHDVVAHAV